MNNQQIRKLKSLAQHLEVSVRFGKEGLSEALLRSVDQALTTHELVKVRFIAFKEDKKNLAPVIAAKTQSELVTRLGNVAVFYRQNPNPGRRKISLESHKLHEVS